MFRKLVVSFVKFLNKGFTRYFASLVVGLVVLFGGNGATVLAQDAANYDAEYSVTNLYSTDGVLTYRFTNMDAAADYIWMLQGMDENGVGTIALGQKFHSGNAALTVAWSLTDFDYGPGLGLTYTGPARVIDNYGNELGRHYLISGCAGLSGFCGAVDWAGAGGINGVDNRVGIGERFHQLDRNADGWFHPYDDAAAVLTRQGDTTILHYRFNPAILPTTDEYRIYELTTGDLMYTFALQDLFEYNDDDRGAFFGVLWQTRSYVVLSTNGEIPAYINHLEDLTAWTNGDNPHAATFEMGAYDYERTTTVGVNVDDGEATFLVGVGEATEWGIAAGAETGLAGGTYTFTLGSRTEEIWDSSYQDHQLTDSITGLLDDDDYLFTERRNDSFTMDVLPAEGFLSWVIFPTVTNMTTAILAERIFFFVLEYEIITSIPVKQRVETTLEGLDLNTDFGRGIAMLLLMLAVMITMSIRGVKGFAPFVVAFLMIGGGWLTLGMGDPITTILFAISAIVLLYLLINSNRKDESF